MSENLRSSSTGNTNRLRNILIALVAIALSTALALAMQTGAGSVTLEAQAKKAVPIDIASSNGKPSLVEFYANWCTSCQAMAKDLATLKQEYQDAVNFVMVNVDNSQWLPEILRYRVDGIPHFVFLDSQGEAIAQTIGEQPLSVMKANLEALIANASLPYAHATGQVSEFEAPVKTLEGNEDDPRSHNQIQ
jgi:thioredoxin-like negative regulator of GroEL